MNYISLLFNSNSSNNGGKYVWQLNKLDKILYYYAVKDEDQEQDYNMFLHYAHRYINEETEDLNIVYRLLGNFYLCKKDDEVALKYLLLAKKLNDCYAYFTLGIYYSKNQNYIESNIIYFEALKNNQNFETDDVIASLYYLIGNNFYLMNKYAFAARYYLLSLEKIDLLLSLCFSDNDAIKMRSELLHRIGCYYQYIMQYKHMIKYLNMACELNNIDSMNQLLKYHLLNNDIIKSKKYAKMIMEKIHDDYSNKNICFINIAFYYGIYEKKYDIVYEIIQNILTNNPTKQDIEDINTCVTVISMIKNNKEFNGNSLNIKKYMEYHSNHKNDILCRCKKCV
jgi:hypothetical protein